jgi:4-hydroxy-tetrahydrodipicolinate reductase
MKIALFGYGRMGHEIERMAREMGHAVVATFDPKAPGVTAAHATAELLKDADVCVEFSLAEAVLANLEAACGAGKPVVIGTTAWESSLPRARQMVESAGTGMIHGPNFAIGVQTLFHVVAECARTLDKLTDCDASVFETHHRGKADSPSGTAKRLARVLIDNLRAKDTMVAGDLQRAIKPNELHVASQRLGVDPGTHVVTFDLGDETVTIKHAARSRAIFARGALKAAEWIIGRKGVYEFTDMLFPKAQARE